MMSKEGAPIPDERMKSTWGPVPDYIPEVPHGKHQKTVLPMHSLPRRVRGHHSIEEAMRQESENLLSDLRQLQQEGNPFWQSVARGDIKWDLLERQL